MRASAVASKLVMNAQAAAAAVSWSKDIPAAGAARKRKSADQASVATYGTSKTMSTCGEFKVHVHNGYKLYRKWMGLCEAGKEFSEDQITEAAQLGRTCFTPWNESCKPWVPTPTYSDVRINQVNFNDHALGRYAYIVHKACREFVALGYGLNEFQGGNNPDSLFNVHANRCFVAAFGTTEPTAAHLEDMGMDQPRTTISQRLPEQIKEARSAMSSVADELGIPGDLQRANLRKRNPRPPGEQDPTKPMWIQVDHAHVATAKAKREARRARARDAPPSEFPSSRATAPPVPPWRPETEPPHESPRRVARLQPRSYGPGDGPTPSEFGDSDPDTGGAAGSNEPDFGPRPSPKGKRKGQQGHAPHKGARKGRGK